MSFYSSCDIASKWLILQDIINHKDKQRLNAINIQQ